MGITGRIKQISSLTLDLFIQDPFLVDAFFDAQWLPESPYWQGRSNTREFEQMKQDARKRFGKLPERKGLSRFIFKNRQKWKYTYDWQALEEQFLAEWATPELDLGKSWQEITFLLAGYIAAYYSMPQGKIPELRVEKGYKKDFLPFIVIQNSQWDGKPLVNAFGAGKEIGYETGYGPVRYLLAGEEVGQILDGLLELSKEGFKNRFIYESQKQNPIHWLDWSDEDLLECMVDYYTEIFDYYKSAVSNQKALLLYLI
ncbi:DUF1877 family protein [Nostoc sp. MS1]|uniref:DUF1877 family protein n=1 Tax=Nostoc sp. MS1 TaxID=2764711 RepID=UPI001CC6852C|nr:DUF1877 family protein [Nostoc sp. MS1]BCL38013.1 hypothetical protein NSMS1_44600 [Nostoc sp. MS1]